jgi:hypothetical protein
VIMRRGQETKRICAEDGAQIRFCVTVVLSAPGRPSTRELSMPAAALGTVWLSHATPADAFPTSPAPTAAFRPWGEVADL